MNSGSKFNMAGPTQFSQIPFFYIGQTVAFLVYSPSYCKLKLPKALHSVLALLYSQTSVPPQCLPDAVFSRLEVRILHSCALSLVLGLSHCSAPLQPQGTAFGSLANPHAFVPSPLAHNILPPGSFFSFGFCLAKELSILLIRAHILSSPRNLPRVSKHMEGLFL